MTRALLAIGLLLLLAGPAAAETIELRGGTTLSGDVQSLDDKSVSITLKSGATLTLPLAKLTPGSVYALRLARLDPKDTAGHLSLGDFCLQHELLAGARAMYHKAGRIDPAQAAAVARRLSAVDEREAAARYALAENAFKNQLHQQALDQLKEIVARFPTTSYAAKARALSQQVIAAMNQPKKLLPAGQPQQGAAAGAKPKQTPPAGKQGKAASPQPIDPAKLTGNLRRLYDQVKKLEQTGDQQNALGLKADGIGNVSRSKKHFEGAIAQYDAAARLLRLAPRSRPPAEVLALFRALFDTLKRKTVHTLMNAAHTMAAERNWRRAADYTDHALRLDPANREALKLKQKIEENRVVRKVSKTSNAKPIVHGK